MLTINKARVSDDNKRIEFDIQIPELSYYKSITIKSIAIYNKDTYAPIGNKSPLYKINTADLKVSDKLKVDTAKKRVYGELSYGEMNNVIHTDKPTISLSSKDMLLIYVEFDGTSTSDIPCGCDVAKEVFFIFDKKLIHSAFMSYINNMKTCEEPLGLMLMLLQYKAILYAMDLKQYQKVFEYWDNLIISGKDTLVTKSCNCNGKGA